jgi:hypothetical protein
MISTWWIGLLFGYSSVYLCGDVKFTDQGGVVGKFNRGNLKIGNLNLRAVKNVIELPARGPAGVRRLPVAIGAF